MTVWYNGKPFHKPPVCDAWQSQYERIQQAYMSKLYNDDDPTNFAKEGSDMEKANIRIDAGKCAECICCQLICSFTYLGCFNPENSHIVINLPGEIYFAEGCKNGCSLCTRYCEHGAINRVREN